MDSFRLPKPGETPPEPPRQEGRVVLCVHVQGDEARQKARELIKAALCIKRTSRRAEG